MKKFLLGSFFFLSSSFAFAAGGEGCGSKTVMVNGEEQHVALECSHAPIDHDDKASLQNGARMFMSYCVGCHSAKYVRYSAVAEGLDIPPELVETYLMFTTDKIGDYIDPQIDKAAQAKWFGKAPPDLSLETRLRGSDWVYTYLLSFYPDASRPYGVNNYLLPNVAMPHVLNELQESTSREEYQKDVGDLVNFMSWMGDPVMSIRHKIGWFVLLFLAIMFIPIYLLNREFWKDIK